MDGLTIVIPARNEEATLGRTLFNLSVWRDQLPELEIIVVDDHSTDKTGRVAKDFGAMLLQNILPPGYGHAVRWGLEHASRPWATVMTADGSDNASDLCAMWNARGAIGMVFGDRWKMGSTEGYPMLKALVNTAGNTYIAHRTGTTYYDWTNPFKLYPTDFVKRVLNDCVAPDQSAGLEITLRIWRYLSSAFTVIPHHWRERSAGQSKFHLCRDSVAYYRTVRRVLG